MTATTKHQHQQPTPRPADYSDVKGSPNVIDWIVNALVMVITWPILFAAKFLNAFVERGGAGIQALGGIAFLAGVFAGADNYYQSFTGKALLPWFTTSDWVGDLAVQNTFAPLRWMLNLWGGQTLIGWGAVLFSIFSIAFLLSLAFSLLTQFIQGQAVRGRSISQAQKDFYQWNAPTMPNAPDPSRKLDMATVSWKELKRTGKSKRTFLGFIAVALWVSEIIAAFAAHNPLNYIGRPGLFIGCIIYAMFTIVAGELGYCLYTAAREESN